MKLVLLRHPPADVPDGVCYGASDVPLAPGWERWAERVRPLLEALPQPISLATSPLARCRRPAERLGPMPKVDEQLREMDFGDWEETPWHAIPRGELEGWLADLVNAAPPGGEALAALNARAVSFVESARAVNAGAVVAVTHGGPVRCMLAHALAMPLDHLFRLRVDPGSVSVVTIAGEAPIVELVNLTVSR